MSSECGVDDECGIKIILHKAESRKKCETQFKHTKLFSIMISHNYHVTQYYKPGYVSHMQLGVNLILLAIYISNDFEGS